MAVCLPAQRYAVFAHAQDVTRIGDTMHAIVQWLARSHHAHRLGGAADLLERYGEGFDPRRGAGDIELWAPIVR